MIVSPSVMSMPLAVSRLGDDHSSHSLAGLLVDLSNSVEFQNIYEPFSDVKSMGLCGSGGFLSTAPQFASSMGKQCGYPKQIHRKRRRGVLNVYFDSIRKSPAPQPALVREHTRRLFLNAKENIGRETQTHAAMLELLCSLIVPSAVSNIKSDNLNGNNADLSETEQILYIILRTGVVTAPTWQRPPVVSRCWLAASIIATLERSSILQRAMCWSRDPDPVVAAASGAHRTCSGLMAFEPFTFRSATSPLSCCTGDVAKCRGLGTSAACGGCLESRNAGSAEVAQSCWGTSESEEVRRLFTRKRPHGAIQVSEVEPSPCGVLSGEPGVCGLPTRVGAAVYGLAGLAVPRFSLFEEVYPPSSPVCALLFIALHRGIVGLQDPYMLLKLQSNSTYSPILQQNSAVSPFKLQSRSSGTPLKNETAFPLAITIDSRFVNTSTSRRRVFERARIQSVELDKGECAERLAVVDARCSRGVVAMLQWGCHSGTLFLRLRQLCDVSEKPEWRAALGQYGKSAIVSLRRLLFLFQRSVSVLSDRPGGPHGVSFKELLTAQQRLRPIAEDIIALSDVFRVHSGDSWDAVATLKELSSATLLSSLYSHFEKRITNRLGCGPCTGAGSCIVRPCAVTELRDVVGDVFISVLRPLHGMIETWLSTGELRDPYDEFFIVPSYGTTSSDFIVDNSEQRLPSFISLAAAQEILSAGVSFRALRAASRQVTQCVQREQKRLHNQEDVNAAVTPADMADICCMLQTFIVSLSGRQSISTLRSAPRVDLLIDSGMVSYWQTFYETCNRTFLPFTEATSKKLVHGPDAISYTKSTVVVVPRRGADSALWNDSSGQPFDTDLEDVTDTHVANLSTLSRQKALWREAMAMEMLRVPQTANENVGAPKKCTALCSMYESGVLRSGAQRRLQQWRAQRLSLNLWRAAAISRAVEDLKEAHERLVDAPVTCCEAIHGEDGVVIPEKTAGDNRCGIDVNYVQPLGEVHSHTADVDVATWNQCDVAHKSNATSLSESALAVCASSSLILKPLQNGRIQTPVDLLARGEFVLTASSHAPSQSTRRTSVSSLCSVSIVEVEVEEPASSANAKEMYVVADINDDEYLLRRAGPHVTDTVAAEELLNKFTLQEAKIRDYDVSSAVYQRKCKEVAQKMLQPFSGDHSEVSPEPTGTIGHLWWTDPTTDNGDFTGFRSQLESVSASGVPSLSEAVSRHTAPTEILTITEHQAKIMLRCPHYYLALGRCASSYLTHKALQVMLLGPFGTLHRLTRQLLDVCLMQNGRVADRLTSLWGELTREAIEENHFNALATLAVLNGAFVHEWESCTPYGKDTLQVAVTILPMERTAFPEEQEDGVAFFQKGTAFRKRAHMPPMTDAHVDNGVSPANDRVTVSMEAAPLPDNPFDFISQLCVSYTDPCEGFWLLPKDAIATYSDLFSTLLFWKSVSQLLARVWCIGMKSGITEVFFFSNVSRSILNAISQHMWFLISGYARQYRQSLHFDTGVPPYTNLEAFTGDHGAFLQRCRFAAMLTPGFARARQQIYGMVRQLEEVEQLLLATVWKQPKTVMSLVTQLAPVDAKGKEGKNKKGRGREMSTHSTTIVNRRVQSRSQTTASRKRESATTLVQGQSTVRGRKRKKRKVQHENGLQGTAVVRVVRNVDWRRKVRDTVWRRLRSLAGLTEIFIENLTLVRDCCVNDEAADTFNEKEGRSRDCTESLSRDAALTSLIRVLELMHSSIKDRL
ncbi:putative Spc97 Spc98 family [Trypanosoma vivax]|uniref:Gamma tubulin complex component protein N-terminal domain-containing protein n=1 Tax=Trypanosoma vivax (strain Y486) TaxID=1055687 RepID=G0U6X3_TRYVY|nr:hypothetical protein TRVL_02811 [Trypanosoma vivax]KAH8611177.1 putative Spc97 Spc98 family [Trypanosoma vivax]CCC51629.1 conserved hypothetical protein [Trypanosoma vivax Y486]